MEKEKVINHTSEKKSGERWCLIEDETNQILGFMDVKDGRDEEGLLLIKPKVMKNFRYQ